MDAAPFRDYATYGYGRFACVWKESGAVIGFSGVKYVPEIGDTELGYRFLPEFWGTLWFILKVLGVVIASEYMTVLFARLRIDQVVRANWRIILPLSLLSLMLTIGLAYWIYPLV